MGIVGFVMILVAIRYISDAVADRSIFNNMLIGVVLAIAGVITGTIVIVGSAFRFFGLNYTNMMTAGSNFNPSTVPAGDWVGLIASVAVGLVVVWAMLLVSAIFVRRSYTSIGSKLNVGMFGTTGLLYLVGAATTIVLVGFVLLFLAQILLLISFLSIEDKPPAMTAPQPQQPMAAGR